MINKSSKYHYDVAQLHCIFIKYLGQTVGQWL